MKSLIRTLSIVVVTATGAAALPFQDKTAVTDDGKKVILKSDGTWSYTESGSKEKDKADE